MPTLRETKSRANVTLIPGSGKPPEEVDLSKLETDISPYMIDPTLAQKEADVIKNRYGGKAIQDSPGGSPPLYEPPKDGGQPGGPTMDFSNRPAYEQIVFKQLGGNPFEVDPVEELNRVTQAEMPNIFNQIFAGQVSWEDRGRLDPAQVKHFDSEVKRFRAHVHEGIVSDVNQRISMYNQLMNRFDNERKYYEAATKRAEAQGKEILANRRAEQKDRTARMDRLSSDRLKVNKDLAEVMIKYQEYSMSAEPGQETPEMQAVMQQYEALMAEKARLDKEIQGLQSKGEFQPAKAGGQAGKTNQRQIVTRKVFPDGRKAVEYDDGTREWVQ